MGYPQKLLSGDEQIVYEMRPHWRALVVPVTSVQGSVQTGNVWVVAADGTQEKRSVGLGLTDGEIVQITEGLVEGDQVLQFIPIGDVVNPDQMAKGGYAVSGFGG